MKQIISTVFALAISTSVVAGPAGLGDNGAFAKTGDNGNKNGWTQNDGGYNGAVPRGLQQSEGKRFDNGFGNGGENANSPNVNGEDAKADNRNDPSTPQR